MGWRFQYGGKSRSFYKIFYGSFFMYTVFYEKNSALWYVSISFYVGMVIFLFISLISYNVTDSSWLYVASTPGTITNQGGFFGGQVAAILFYFFGGASFLLFITLLCAGLIVFTQRSIKKEWERLCACSYLVFVGAALLTTYCIDLPWSPYPGGMMGLVFAKMLIYYFDSIGCTLFLYSSLCASFVLLFRWSFMFLVHYGIAAAQAIYLFMKKYHVVSKSVHGVVVCLHAVFIRTPLFFIRFIQSLLDGSAFNGTGLVHPEEIYEYEQAGNFDNIIASAPASYVVLLLSRND